MEIALFAIAAIVVYLLSDWIVRTIESSRGTALQNRQIIFFIIFFGLILVSFELIKIFFRSGG